MTPSALEYSAHEQRAWYFYDFANSAFPTTVVAVLLGPYLTSLAKAAADLDGFVRPFGIAIAAESVWPYVVSLSVLIQVFVFPLVGALADYGGRKRELLAVLAYIGAGANIAMYWLDSGRYLLGAALFLVANVAFGASIVVYNSFLPEIAPPERRDEVSSKGWAFGFLGGGLLLAANLLLYTRAAQFGISAALAVRINLLSAGLWWALFTVQTLRFLRNRHPARHAPPGHTAIGAAIGQLAGTLREIKRYPQTMLFLAAYLIYNDGIQTVISMAVQFGSEELKLSMSVLTGAILLVQFVAIGGAMLFNLIARYIGNQRAVLVGLAIWAGAVFYMYVSVGSALEFLIAASLVGVVMGGTQALSRSIFSLLIPAGREAEYFSVYEISDKGTSWLGPLFFGLALQLTHSFRLAVLSLVIFFVIGMLLLARVNLVKAVAAVKSSNPPY